MDSSALLKDQREAEQGRDIRALLVLIKCISDKDVVDFGSSGGANNQVDIAQVGCLFRSTVFTMSLMPSFHWKDIYFCLSSRGKVSD